MKHYTEEQVAEVVVAWLEARGYEVFQEVELVNGGIRADIVAKRGPELTIVETKTSASLALLYQAMERRRFAHRVYVAVPLHARAMREVCSALGVGLLEVKVPPQYEESWNPARCEEVVSSKRWNTKPVKLMSRLRPEHKTAARAGSTTGGHWSRWRDTCAQLSVVVAREPGLKLKDAVSQIKHHYSSGRVAISTMGAHVREGRVTGVKLENGALWPVVEARGVGAGKAGGE